MSVKSLIVVLGFAAFVANPALAQNPPPRPVGVPSPSQVQPPRIEIHPGSRPVLYRRCTDWYELQNRPSGTVLYPGKHCWWVRG
jgi:hypothetical protein